MNSRNAAKRQKVRNSTLATMLIVFFFLMIGILQFGQSAAFALLVESGIDLVNGKNMKTIENEIVKKESFYQSENRRSEGRYVLDPPGTLKWKIYTSEQNPISAAIGDDGTVYFSGAYQGLCAFDPNGTIIWRYSNRGQESGLVIGPDGTIYFADGEGVCALNSDGTEKWAYSLGSGKHIIYFRSDSAGAVGIDGTFFIVSNHEESGIYLYAFDPFGELKWKFPIGGGKNDCFSSIGPDGTIYVGAADHNLYAIKPDGTLKWKFLASGRICYNLVIGYDGAIYFGTSDNRLYCVNIDGTKRWQYDEYVGSRYIQLLIPSVTDIYGNLYIRQTSDLFLFDPNSLKKKWGLNPALLPYDGAIDSNGTYYSGSYDQTFKAIDSSGRVDWEFATGDYTITNPLIDTDGTIYFGCRDYFYALSSDSIGLANSSWPKWKHDNKNSARYDAETDFLPKPPLNFLGQRKWQKSLFSLECIINLSWKSNPINGDHISKYRLYSMDGQNKTLLAELDINTFEYLHRKAEKEKEYRYAISAVDIYGNEGLFAYAKIKAAVE